MIEYKILKEFDKFYLCEHPKGYKTCFRKDEHNPTEDGCIVVKDENTYVERQGLPSDKVNKSFNESKFGNV